MRLHEGKYGTTVNARWKSNGRSVKIVPVYKEHFQSFLRVNWANANLLRGFSVLSVFNYKIKDYAPEMFFAYFLKGSKLPLPQFSSNICHFYVVLHRCFWYEGKSIPLGIVFGNLVCRACFSHESGEIRYSWDEFYFGRVYKLNCSIILTGRICVIGT